MNYPTPTSRRLKGFAFDPSLSINIETAGINKITYNVSWESKLEPGPIGEYVEVVDYDPTTKTFYKPINLNDSSLLAQDGLDPSESNPQFHQQMVYAICMTTIRNFEKALGRKIFWSPVQLTSEFKKKLSPNSDLRVGDMAYRDSYVKRLRIYPHAFRDTNAFYSPQKKALLFGYFNANSDGSNGVLPDSLVFTCLSHDIVAHELTHAILDGMYPLYSEGTNPDVLAFHEAFADLVALFQHFTFPEVLKHQIAKTKGYLASQNLLGQLAQEFGNAIGKYGSLRDAIGSVDPETRKWKLHEPTGREYKEATEPHDRGSVLVAAIFDAFLTIYKTRISDLLRIASQGTGILPVGEIPSDLVNRLADEAAKCAEHILRICIRALDYCPPTDITFGDYLRAIITADFDLTPNDRRNYRIAFIEGFRRRGIYPNNISSLSVESLRYGKAEIPDSNQIKVLGNFLREFRNNLLYVNDRAAIFEITQKTIIGSYEKQGLFDRIGTKFEGPEFEIATGLKFTPGWKELGIRTSRNGYPSFEIHSLKIAHRVGPDGEQCNQVIISLIQKAYLEKDKTGKLVPIPQGNNKPNSFAIKGGCTIIFDLETMELKYCIAKPLIDRNELKVNKKYIINKGRSESALGLLKMSSNASQYYSYFQKTGNPHCNEPFSFLHQH
jgi:hypothetical protein